MSFRFIVALLAATVVRTAGAQGVPLVNPHEEEMRAYEKHDSKNRRGVARSCFSAEIFSKHGSRSARIFPRV